MKRLVILSLAFALSTLTYAQDPFKVITVNGEIVAIKAKLTLENGVEVYSDDNFDFRKPNSRAAMINAERGRVVLTEQNAADAFSRAAFAPAISTVSARSGAVSSLTELQSVFADKMVIIDHIDLQIGKEYFPMDSDKFFFIRYQYNGETINKQLPFNNDVITIAKDEIFTVDGKPIDKPDSNDFSLYYHNKTDGKPESILISTFTPVFLSGLSIKPEVNIIVEEFSGQPYERVLSEVYDYLNSFYGNVDKVHLDQWLKNEFNISQ